MSDLARPFRENVWIAVEDIWRRLRNLETRKVDAVAAQASTLVVFTVEGDIAVQTYNPRLCPGQRTFDTVRVCFNTAPTGSSAIVRLKKNGSGLAATAVTITAGSTEGETTDIGEEADDGDYYQVEVTQVGSTVAGADMTVHVE